MSERMPLPKSHKDRHTERARERAERAEVAKQHGQGKAVRDELKSEAQIRKERKKQEHVRIRNLPKDKRRIVVNKLKQKKKERRDFQQKQQFSGGRGRR